MSKPKQSVVGTATVWRRARAFWARHRLFNLLLLLFVFWLLADPEWRVRQFLRSSNSPGEQPIELDSFSRPCIARAVLANEAERLLGAYTGARDGHDELQALLQQKPELFGKQTLHYAAQLTEDAVKDYFIPQSSTIGPLEDLHQQIEELHGDLDRKLLVVYSQNGRWNEFLDRYLHLLRTEPEHRAVLNWVRTALVCSQRCGRSDELLDALGDVIRFHGDLKTVPSLRATLNEWRSAHGHGPGLASQ